ncbi:hypothetical protein [Thermoactinomyces sp. DSM 45892]|uniref:hypothetical protein n=1 Tax=Thermoactinomyces sp. DSM 45892 TaxID=1882753 RepID=UPI0008957B40|nr:hypothetical protein [Thermoactinomyces sp. DSM 45892]SDY35785.1 hypothetical protein SAMN05444416_10426 [Thermoactinomyces sp. DSM 45892]
MSNKQGLHIKKSLKAISKDHTFIFSALLIVVGVIQWISGSFPMFIVVGAMLLLYRFSDLDIDGNDERTQFIRQKSALVGYAAAVLGLCSLYVIASVFPVVNIKTALLIVASIVFCAFPLSMFIYSKIL